MYAGVLALLWLTVARGLAEPDGAAGVAPADQPSEAPNGAGMSKRAENENSPTDAAPRAAPHDGVVEGAASGAHSAPSPISEGARDLVGPPSSGALPAATALAEGARDAGAPPRAAQPSAPETPNVRQARELTARARERFEAGDFRAALVEFSGAYELLSNDPRRAELLNNIAVCHERMFRYDLAVHYYERYLREGAPDAADRAEVEAVLRGLRGLLGTLRITANVSSEIWIDDRPYGVLSRELLVPAGPHVIELRARAHESARREVRVVPRAAQSLHFDLEPLPQYRGVHRAYFWSGVGVTSAALIAGGALGLRALGVEKDAEALNDADVATVYDERKYKNLALASDLTFGTAALFAVGTTVLFFLTDWGKGEREARPAQQGVRVSFDPAITPSAVQVAVRGGWR